MQGGASLCGLRNYPSIPLVAALVRIDYWMLFYIYISVEILYKKSIFIQVKL